MNFAEAENYLYSLGNEVETMKLGLENISRLLSALDHPQNKYLKVQIAGTNGKGSVCAFLDSICISAGIRTGRYTSPHLISITERIKIGGEDISKSDFARIATLVREAAEDLLANGVVEYLPTFFEQVTAIALIAFAEANVKLAILETGLGGRFDATTAANAELIAITPIDLDHQEYLGETIEEIAAEKAAIIRPNSKVVIGNQNVAAMSVLLARCMEVGVVPRTECKADVWAIDTHNKTAVVGFRTDLGFYHDPDLGLKGRHQIENARIAVMTAEVIKFDFGFEVSVDNIDDGLENARHSGRLEYIGQFLLDGAHNISAVKALVTFLGEFETRPLTMVFGVMKDKDIEAMTKILFPVVDRLILTRVSNSRSADPNEVMKFVSSEQKAVIADSVTEAIAVAREISDDGLIVVTGSLYLVGEVKKLLNN